MILPSPSSPLPDRRPLLNFFQPKPIGSWIAIGVFILAILVCWGAFFGSIQARFDGYSSPSIEADATTYFQMAGIQPSSFTEQMPLISFSGNLLGPVLIAKVLRHPFFVMLFNLALLVIMVHIAACIPGVRRRYFLVLFFLNAESYVAIVSLNKEILASFGLIAFAAACTARSRRKLFILPALVFSIMARWEQLAILLLYAFLECRLSPFRRRHKLSLLFVLGVLTVTYVAIVRYSGIDVAGFLAVAETSGIIARLDSLQSKFGLPLVIIPKMLMNLYNRILLPAYFFSSDYLTSDFSDLQGNVIIHLHTLIMLVLSVTAFLKRRLNVSDQIPFLIYLYLMVTAVSPFVQPRYQFPIYTLLCLQLSIDPAMFRSKVQQVAQYRGRFVTQSSQPLLTD